MPAQLDPEERFVIAYLRSDRIHAARWGWLFAKLFAAVVFFIGFSSENRGLIFSGFATLLALEPYVAVKQPRMTRAISSAVAKLENRITELEAAEPPEQ